MQFLTYYDKIMMNIYHYEAILSIDIVPEWLMGKIRMTIELIIL